MPWICSWFPIFDSYDSPWIAYLRSTASSDNTMRITLLDVKARLDVMKCLKWTRNAMRFQILLALWQKQRPDPEKNDVGHYTFRGQFEFESWVWFGTEFELFHCFLLKVESQWRWLSFETWTKIFVLSHNSQPANQKRFASGRRIAHNVKKSRSFSVLTNQNNRICHMTQKQWNVLDFRSTFSSFDWKVALFQNYYSA